MLIPLRRYIHIILQSHKEVTNSRNQGFSFLTVFKLLGSKPNNFCYWQIKLSLIVHNIN
jgi:hypothetical protein